MADHLHHGPPPVKGPFALTVDGHVADVSIDHPPSNIFDGQFTVALHDLLDRCEADPDVRVLLFHSADPDFFVMHGDARAFMDPQVALGTEVAAPDPTAALLERVHRSRLLSIAAIDGAARGGGAELVSALDLRIGGPRTVFAQFEVALGLLPGWGAPARLPHLLGRSRALDVLLTCRDVGAEEALAMGWLDRLVPSDRVLVEAGRVARRIGAMGAESIAAVKTVVDMSLGGIANALVAESTMLTRLAAEGGFRSRTSATTTSLKPPTSRRPKTSPRPCGPEKSATRSPRGSTSSRSRTLTRWPRTPEQPDASSSFRKVSRPR